MNGNTSSVCNQGNKKGSGRNHLSLFCFVCRICPHHAPESFSALHRESHAPLCENVAVACGSLAVASGSSAVVFGNRAAACGSRPLDYENAALACGNVAVIVVISAVAIVNAAHRKVIRNCAKVIGYGAEMNIV